MSHFLVDARGHLNNPAYEEGSRSDLDDTIAQWPVSSEENDGGSSALLFPSLFPDKNDDGNAAQASHGIQRKKFFMSENVQAKDRGGGGDDDALANDGASSSGTKRTLKVGNTLSEAMLTQTFQRLTDNRFTPFGTGMRLLAGRTQGFDVDPPQILFSDISPGVAQSVTITLTNVSDSFNSFRIGQLPPPVRSLFKVDWVPASKLSAGMTSTVTLHFTPQQNTRISTSLPVATQSGMMSVPILCQPMDCVVSVEPTSLNFETLAIGEECTRVLALRNSGSLPARVTLHGEGVAQATRTTCTKNGVTRSLMTASPPFSPGSANVFVVIPPKATSKVSFTYSPMEPSTLDEKISVEWRRATSESSSSSMEEHHSTRGENSSSPSANGNSATVVRLRGSATELPVQVAHNSLIDFGCCMLNGEYCEKITITSKMSSAVKVTPRVTDSIGAQAISFYPPFTFVQGGQTTDIWVFFKPSAESITDRSVLNALMDREVRTDVDLDLFGIPIPLRVSVLATVTNGAVKVHQNTILLGSCLSSTRQNAAIVVSNLSFLPQMVGFGDLPAAVRILPRPVMTLLPFETFSFSVSLEPPKIAGEFMCNLALESENGTTQNIVLRGFTVFPTITFSASSIHLPPCPYGGTVRASISAQNRGTEKQFFEIESDPYGEITVLPRTGEIGAHEEIPIFITFSPLPGNYLGVSRAEDRENVEIADNEHDRSILSGDEEGKIPEKNLAKGQGKKDTFDVVPPLRVNGKEPGDVHTSQSVTPPAPGPGLAGGSNTFNQTAPSNITLGTSTAYVFLNGGVDTGASTQPSSSSAAAPAKRRLTIHCTSAPDGIRHPISIDCVVVCPTLVVSAVPFAREGGYDAGTGEWSVAAPFSSSGKENENGKGNRRRGNGLSTKKNTKKGAFAFKAAAGLPNSKGADEANNPRGNISTGKSKNGDFLSSHIAGSEDFGDEQGVEGLPLHNSSEKNHAKCTTIVPFSKVCVGQKVSRAIHILNQGMNTLFLRPTPLDPFGPYQLLQPPPLTLQPGESCNCTIVFSPVANGTFSETFRIRPSPYGNDVVVNLTGQAMVANMLVVSGDPSSTLAALQSPEGPEAEALQSTKSIGFGHVIMGSTIETPVTIVNMSEFSYSVEIAMEDPTLHEATNPDGYLPFSVSPNQFFLPAKGLVKIIVAFSPMATHDFNATINFAMKTTSSSSSSTDLPTAAAQLVAKPWDPRNDATNAPSSNGVVVHSMKVGGTGNREQAYINIQRNTGASRFNAPNRIPCMTNDFKLPLRISGGPTDPNGLGTTPKTAEVLHFNATPTSSCSHDIIVGNAVGGGSNLEISVQRVNGETLVDDPEGINSAVSSEGWDVQISRTTLTPGSQVHIRVTYSSPISSRWKAGTKAAQAGGPDNSRPEPVPKKDDGIPGTDLYQKNPPTKLNADGSAGEDGTVARHVTDTKVQSSPWSSIMLAVTCRADSAHVSVPLAAATSMFPSVKGTPTLAQLFTHYFLCKGVPSTTDDLDSAEEVN